jgi:antitoxin PrlF
MPAATMTSKGQITIPAKVRAALSLKPGTRIDFYEIEKGEFVLRPKTRSIRELEGCLAYDGPPVSIAEMNEAILQRASELDEATKSGAQENQSDGEAA